MNMKLKFKFKFILFTEVLVMFIVAMIHIVSNYIFGIFPWVMYPLMAIIILLSSLFTLYVIVPVANWFFKD